VRAGRTAIRKETAMAIALTGIKPTGTPHLGNYLGMIRPALALAVDHDAYYFVADAHALNTTPEPAEVGQFTQQAAATLLALGLNPERSVLYRQSDVLEVFQLSSILACVTPKGLLNRAHAYKAAVDANVAGGRDPDAGVNMGLYTYPVLMAADILCLAAQRVPVGLDQRQHLEIARDIAQGFNRRYGEVLTVPEAAIVPRVATIPGLDGRKMSKSYGNTIPIFGGPDDLRRAVQRIVTDSRPPHEPRDPDSDLIFQLFQHVAPAPDVDVMRRRLREGGLGYAAAKRRLFEALEATFGDARRRYVELVEDPAEISRILTYGGARVRLRAARVLATVRDAVGLDLATPRVDEPVTPR